MGAPVKIERKPKSPLSTLGLFAIFGLVLLIIFNRDLSDWLGQRVGMVLAPLIGFGGTNPLATIFLASVILVIATTAVRHFLVDWVNTARIQEAVRAFSREFSDARKTNNTYKMKKLTEAQPEIMQLQADMSTDQMKPMAVTMLLVIPIFAWLAHFMVTIAGAGYDAAASCAVPVQVPWDSTWELIGPVACGGSWWFLPHWIILYSLFGIPFGTVAQRALKLWEYSRVDLDGDGRPAKEEL